MPHLPVDAAGHHRVRWVEVGVDPRTEGAEGIEAFGARPLTVSLLQVAGSDVIADGVTENIFLGAFCGDVLRALADDHHQLAFMFHLFRLRRQDDMVSGRDDGRGRLEEDQRHLRHLVPEFLGVLHVIASHADDLARLAGSQRRQLLERDARLTSAVFTEHVPLYLSHLVFQHPAVRERAFRRLITDDSHVFLS